MTLKNALVKDTEHAVILAEDWWKVSSNQFGGIPRSTTFADWQLCWANGVVNDALSMKQPGPVSMLGYVKVRVRDFQGPSTAPPVATKNGKKVIRDFPHPCPACGGWMLQLFTSTEHEGGVCPATLKARR